MRVVLEKNQDTIDLKDVSLDHIIVGYNNDFKEWCLLTRENYDEGTFSFRTLTDEFTNGNGYSYSGFVDISKAIQAFKGDVFAFNTMKEAMEFLLPKLD